MPIITVGDESSEVPAMTRLAQAIENMGVQIGHRCGGYARCTTCRVRFIEGEPDTYTRAEFKKLGLDKGELPHYRLSCQIVCDHDMNVEPLMTLEDEGWPDTGPALAAEVTPEAEFLRPDALMQDAQEASD